ncbi:type III-B CRISPR module RAMP protein Cmr1 [Thioflexithrix psekupsensis]|uniref:Type III-B CRISPR module RAMP protein Cmr1 n=1 Tax=Thioflexithrix psekupsensis TaxID=1570016 RepID=A0A251X993_9GAMM|nr:type III-B CRISPR module RAMP protein Cmr1 [Thioflexithrix psekupsensis]OUD14541.1 type III-B CRISPR module RAMP protein Cmr1 [Thioflexithrix psekupsensis]
MWLIQVCFTLQIIERVEFKCKTITPLFMAGADGKTAELRPPSIKGVLRFWWRAIHGNLSPDKLKETEKQIFGGVGENNNSLQSRFFVRVEEEKNGIKILPKELVPHKSFTTESIEGTFTVKFCLKPHSPECITINEIRSLFIVSALLGGFGKRSRRGMGSIAIEEIDGSEFVIADLTEELLKHLNVLNPKQFKQADQKQRSQNSFIISTFQKSPHSYPCITKIEIGKPTEDNLPKKISNASHSVNKNHAGGYHIEMGGINNPPANINRFASPIYASVVADKSGKRPIITTLNNTLLINKKPNPDIPKEFKDEVFK